MSIGGELCPGFPGISDYDHISFIIGHGKRSADHYEDNFFDS